MFYKFENNKWEYGYTVCLPSGEILTEENKINSDGWEWHDNPPENFNVTDVTNEIN
jgi:hypothetical protein